MKRLFGMASLVAATALMSAGGASAAPPGTGCPPGFQLVHTSIFGDDPISGKIVDLHGDEMVCLRFLRPGGAVFFDNVVP
jgi:hypothetical protein